MAVNIRGKDYEMVHERLIAIHEDNEYVSVYTEIAEETEAYITFQAQIEVVKDDRTMTYLGHAREYFEFKDKRNVNFANALENCETSAIGRALSSAGYCGSGFASKEEKDRVEPKTKARASQLEDKSADRKIDKKESLQVVADSSAVESAKEIVSYCKEMNVGIGRVKELAAKIFDWDDDQVRANQSRGLHQFLDVAQMQELKSQIEVNVKELAS